ncbi:THUMP domain-containing class I SAM-dependent RNA methyltransferase [Ferruginibacter albus]|uniref:THUMP domain-containing class I SAM-dependent RNA methyltransferase n=1 Tax=Ferruginibacter albus TaxID=2875540 RepID=UPI001CC5A955|nr:class I SAM-dependent RNA methyltransferase [Ferruginibacter albus]UAY52551.1 class I SAM-dependent RNA methyltransferase [Ferruginibacter albus]
MELFKTKSRIIVTCSNRLSPYLQQEIAELGFTPVRIFKTGVELKGTLNDCILLNLNLRCASQVLFSIKEFEAYNADTLYKVLFQFEWENIFSGDGYFSITSNVSNPTINNSLFANVKVKDAIVDRFRNKTGKRPNSGPELDKTVIHLYWKESYVEVFIDTSGETLSKHGYRRIPGRAPMLESLAASTLLATKWDRRSAFVNPMCGSGTLAIEAALLATNRMPGLYRSNYAFMHLIGYDESFYAIQRTRLTEKIIAVPGLKIVATDLSTDAVNVSKINAGAAGVADMIDFAVCDFGDTSIPANEPGVIFFNPEYGERLGEETALQAIYARMGDFMKQHCKGYTGYIFTGNLELAKKIGLKPSRRIEFFTSKIDCRLFEYELYSGTKRQSKEDVPST